MRKFVFVALAIASTGTLAGDGDGTGNSKMIGDLFLTLQEVLAWMGSYFL